MKSKNKALFGALLVVCMTLPVAPVQAQGGAQLEEVVVTAERRETILQDTPIAIYAFPEEILIDAGIRNLQELQNIAPSLVVAGNRGSGDGNLNVAIRGIGQRSSRINGERGVGLYMDGIYYATTEGSNLMLRDIDRVEILRGPQGTLFGRNNTGGAVRYFTRRADMDSSYGSAEVTFGDYNRREIIGVGNLAVSDTLAFRGVAAWNEIDGYMDWVDASGNDTGRDAQGARKDKMLRGSMRWLPSDTVTVDLGVAITDSENNGVVSDTLSIGSGTSGFIGEVNAALINETGTGLAPVDDPRVLTSSPFTNFDSCLLDGDGIIQSRVQATPAANPFDYCDTPRLIDTVNTYLDINWDISDNLSFQSLTGYNDIDANYRYDWSTWGTYMRSEILDTKFWSQEFQLSGDAVDNRLSWVAGLTFFHHEGTGNNLIWQNNTRSRPKFDVTQGQTEILQSDTDSIGIYGQGTYSFTEQLSLTLGLRYSEDDKSILTQRSTWLNGWSVTNEASWDDTNYRVALDYAWTDDIMTYASVSTAYKAGGFPSRATASLFNPAVAGNPAIVDDDRDLIENAGILPQEPENVINYELGFRSQFGGRARINLTAFYMEYTDLQRGERKDDPTDPDCNNVFEDGNCTAIFLSGNVGKVEIKGLEGETLYQFTENFRGTFNFSYIKTEVVDNENSNTLVVGDPLEQAPEFNWTLGLNYSYPLSNGATLDISGMYAAKDEFVAPFGNTDNMVPGFETLNARIQYTAAEGKWYVALGGTNLTDETFSYGRQNWGRFFGNLIQDVRGAPRQVYLNAKYYFGNGPS